jgi:hypothetical protein
MTTTQTTAGLTWQTKISDMQTSLKTPLKADARPLQREVRNLRNLEL